MEQGLKWADAHHAYLHYIFETLDVEADLLQLGTPITDGSDTQFTALFAARPRQRPEPVLRRRRG